ncbi:MAG: S1/P1 nuclease, partial [bacterium]|nr:S1/P1 nuclease [bacterium]
MKHYLAVCGLVIASTFPAQAWYDYGHSTVAEIAQTRLNPTAAAAVNKILSGRSLASVADWADEYRESHPETRNWHFVNMPIDVDVYDPAKHCVPSRYGDCAIAEIERLRNDLRCAPGPKDKATALRFAVHFVGDLHQPFHTVAENHGEHSVHVGVFVDGVRCTGGCRTPAMSANFHEVWDSVLLDKAAWSWGGTVDRIESGWLASDEAKTPGIDGGAPVDWLIETHELAA